MRTSQSHPLEIAEAKVGPGLGSVGITFCPGKKQPGAWDRDLGLDLDAIHAFGASALVTLIEDHEISDLGVHGIGERAVLGLSRLGKILLARYWRANAHSRPALAQSFGANAARH